MRKGEEIKRRGEGMLMRNKEEEQVEMATGTGNGNLVANV